MLHFNNEFGFGRPTVIVNNVLFVLGRVFLTVAAITAFGALVDGLRYMVGF